MTTAVSPYPELKHFFGAYLNQDHYLLGDSLEAVLESYVEDHMREELAALLDEVHRFVAKHADNLESAAEATFALDVELAAFGGSVRGFFETLSKCLYSAIADQSDDGPA